MPPPPWGVLKNEIKAEFIENILPEWRFSLLSLLIIQPATIPVTLPVFS